MDVGEDIVLSDATVYDDDWIPSTAP